MLGAVAKVFKKPLRKVFGKSFQENLSWGKWKKKTGINRMTKMLSGVNSAQAYDARTDIYGHSGTIVGRY